jgi:hypothetical protein
MADGEGGRHLKRTNAARRVVVGGPMSAMTNVAALKQPVDAAALGHQLFFATRSETRPRHAGEGQLSGYELEGRFGSTRPFAAAHDGQLWGRMQS